ncbi:MupG family TIM beta-alpha barrel fold protein [Culicoidibacter larvae]|uniref:DUF871 domain-containing protein n=1 Tax=Culicoidibacter larvae TaxID=2579976 RepID=A0A5R8Q837_9FIRM|nr:MupG family TIM beta-alpha barrel fold protein [Culicoidibacter larvae]TLG71297.1 DUF871 domain-containing protein [Culicoidibacter larvae]TLG71301.1 DUF871 domain-containing protein [Culicoidibacter larvae]
MKKEVGISVYPEFYDLIEIKRYLKKASDLGFTKAFTALQIAEYNFSSKAKTIGKNEFKEIFSYAKSLGINFTADTTRNVFDSLGATPTNLEPFYDLGLATIRIDAGFDYEEICSMTNNKYGIIIESNASFSTPKNKQYYEEVKKFCKLIMDFGNITQLVTCFNYFPRMGTGHSKEFVKEVVHLYKEYSIPVSAFVASQFSAPDLNEHDHGVQTIEEHRFMAPHLAAQELFCLGVSNVIIGDSMASESELSELSRIKDLEHLEIPVLFNQYLPKDIENKIKSIVMTSRVDQPADIIRSTDTRGIELAPLYCAPRIKYSVTMDNIMNSRYAGELQIVLKEYGPRQNINVIGKIAEEGRHLLPYILYGNQRFVLINK